MFKMFLYEQIKLEIIQETIFFFKDIRFKKKKRPNNKTK